MQPSINDSQICDNNRQLENSSPNWVVGADIVSILVTIVPYRVATGEGIVATLFASDGVLVTVISHWVAT